MKKIFLILILSIFTSACSSIDYKIKLTEAYPDYDSIIETNFSSNDAKILFEEYEKDNSISLPEACHKAVLNSENTPKIVKDSINYINNNDYDLTSGVYTRLEDNEDVAAIVYNVYSSSKDKGYDITYIFNDQTKELHSIIVSIANDDITDSNSYSFIFFCMEVMMSVDNSFENDVMRVSEIFDASFDGVEAYNGFTYEISETYEDTFFTIKEY